VEHRSEHHLAHLGWHAGHRVDHLVTDRAYEPSCRTRHLRDRLSPHRDVRLAQVVLRHDPAAGLEELPDPFGDRLIASHLDAHDAGDHVAGDVILGRPQSTAADNRVAALQRLPDGGLDAGEVVADLDLEIRVDAGECQLFPDPSRVTVDDDAEQQLGADGDDFAAHASPKSSKTCKPRLREWPDSTNTRVRGARRLLHSAYCGDDAIMAQ
jgi:hypothetical protein